MIEKILERLSVKEKHHKDMANDKTGVLSEIDKCSHLHYAECFKEAKEIVHEVAKEYAEIARESREDFMEIVYSELEEDADNYRANRIIDAFDTYAPYQQEAAKEYGKDTNVRSNGWIPVEVELPPMPKENPLFENKPLELYLATIKGADYPFRVFWNGKFFTDGWGKVEAIAWMPLPPRYAPYQKGE